MKNWLPLLLLLSLWACKKKKADLSGDAPVKASDFISAFPKLTGNFMVTDTNMVKEADTLTIGYKVFTQFIPDSIVTAINSKDKRLTIHPVGLIEKDKEIYLLVNFTQRKKTKLAVFVTDKKIRFLAGKELLSDNNNDGYFHTVSINKEPTFIISKEKPGKNNITRFSRTGWVYNNTGTFMVVINDSNEDPGKTAVINPLDTLPRRNKFSGDYVQDKKNFISLRDGKNAGTYLFFIHFEKDEGSCTGELKGELKMKSSNSAQYTRNGDPCVIDFGFEGNQLSLKEQGSCGNHRGIKCYFNDHYTKKKEPKTGRRK